REGELRLSVFDHADDNVGIHGMIIKSIRTIGFRNLKSEKIGLSPCVNAFIGLNAQGKTNILEAVSVLADGRSFRGARMQEVIRFDQNECAVEGIIVRNDQENSLKVFISRGNRRFFVNNNQVSDLRDFLGRFSYVVFSTESMAVIDGDPKARRDFLDHGCFLIDPLYLLTLREYRRALKSRNILLKNESLNKTLISTWNIPISRFGAVIIHSRINYLNLLRDVAADIHNEMSLCTEQLKITYASGCLGDDNEIENNVKEIEKQLMMLLDNEIDSDIRRGSTMSGPHRDEMKIQINDKDLRFFGSRGQKRTAVLSLKLAELDVFHRKMDDYPVLLLDDIASEFDENRQKELIRAIPDNIQVIVSHTDRLTDHFQRPIHYYRVTDGCATSCSQ
ncbi:DNA replication/repair protein RecF, partial [bacterium]|nr:DNA replication/repair protein RecF [bacterium]